MSDETPTKANPNYTLAGGLFLVALTLAAYIVCEVLKINSGPVLSITGPVIAAMFLADKITRVEHKTEEVRKQTNGLLTGDGGAIEAAVDRVLDRRIVQGSSTQAGLTAQTFSNGN